uniref:Receptor ligand binding region domain-containing protein n=1 Tax=Caenorhabditis japonica TaxID=281687 RepID=A0A8R1IUM7_CAEJA
MTILFDQCNENLAAGNAIKLFADYKVDVLIGPTTNIRTTDKKLTVLLFFFLAALPVFILATYYNVPLITWGMTSSAVLDDSPRFPTAGILSVGSKSLAIAFREVMLEYGWDQFVYAYSLEGDDEKCETMRDDFQDMIAYYGDIVLSYTVQIMDLSEQGLLAVLKDVSTRGRTIVQEDGSYRYPWIERTGPDPSDHEAIPGFQRSIYIADMQGQGQIPKNYSTFNSEVIRRMKDPPYNCTDACSAIEYQTAATYAGQLHDSVYLYGMTMNRMMKTNPNQYRNGTAFHKYLNGSFEGVGGPVEINEDGVRNPTLFVLTLDANNTSSTIQMIEVNQQTAKVTKLYTNEAQAVWSNRKGIRPLDEPICGYTGSKCPANVLFEYLGWFIAAIIVIAMTIIGAILAFVHLFQ